MPLPNYGEYVRIALDVMGTDLGAAELVDGALQALSRDEITVTLVGDEQEISDALGSRSSDSRIEVVHATQVITMDDSPMDALRKKKDSSMILAFDLLKKGQVDAAVSAGNSGAIMASAIRYLGRLKGIQRPAIVNVFPTQKKPVVMADVGANVDCRAKHLYQFGVMAAAFAKIMFGLDAPRVGLLSNGAEEGKGNALVKKTHALLADSTLNFIGNIEGCDTFQGNVDVIVCDGFVGNVCLKLSEGLAESLLSMLREEISQTFKAKIGYFLARRAFAKFKKRVDYAETGGAPLLGLNETAIICHGRSNATAIKNAIFVADELAANRVNDLILEMLAEGEI